MSKLAEIQSPKFTISVSRQCGYNYVEDTCMDRVRPWLYIGSYRDTLNPHLLAAYKIGAMLQLAGPVDHPGIASLYLSLEDGLPIPAGLLRQGVDFVITHKNANQVVLIACGAGISRSAAFTIATLKEVEGVSLPEALRTVKERHPAALPHPAIWESLCAYYHENVSLWDMR